MITIHAVNGTKLFGIYDATPAPDRTWIQEK